MIRLFLSSAYLHIVICFVLQEQEQSAFEQQEKEQEREAGESVIVREIRLQQEREQELRRLRQSITDQEPVSPQPAPTQEHSPPVRQNPAPVKASPTPINTKPIEPPIKQTTTKGSIEPKGTEQHG